MKLFGKNHAAPTEGYAVIKSDADWRQLLASDVSRAEILQTI